MEQKEDVRWDVALRLEKYITGEDEPYEVIEDEGNLLLTAGVLHLWKLARGDAVSAFSTGNARIGVGDSNAAEAAGQTDLQAASNKLRRVMESGWPKVGTADGLSADNQMELKSSFGSSEANFVWAEWGIFNAASGGVMLNRKVAALGTKASGTTWVLTVTVSLT